MKSLIQTLRRLTGIPAKQQKLMPVGQPVRELSKVVHIRAPQPEPEKPYLAAALQDGWRTYGLARNAFVQFSPKPYYAYESQYLIGVCAVAAIYLSLSGAPISEVQHIGYDAAMFGITRITGINYDKVLGPAVQPTEFVHKGEMVRMLPHLMTLTDTGWPQREIVAWAYAAERSHRERLLLDK